MRGAGLLLRVAAAGIAAGLALGEVGDPRFARRHGPYGAYLLPPLIDIPGPYLLLAAMPCGINTLLVSHVYGLDIKLAAQAVAWSTAIAVLARTTRM